MNSLENIHTIFFDYDGTLHDSIHIYAPAFRKAFDYLVHHGYTEYRIWEDNEISQWLGYNPTDMWNAFCPRLEDQIKKACSEIISNEMKHQIFSGNAKLYEGSLETLDYLKKKGYHLVFISNCKTYYMEAQSSFFHLSQYFEAMYCSEQFNFMPKYEILKEIKEKFVQNMVIVGDRKQDIEAGSINKITTVGCSYGYAQEEELEEAGFIIDDIKSLVKLL